MSFCLNCGNPTTQQIPTGDSRPRAVCSHCDYIHYENPKLICGCLLVHDDKVLLCRRAIEPRYGYWTLPAGFMELGETMQQGANRECVEEAEANGDNLQLYCLYDIPDLGQIHVFYLGDLANGAYGVGEESLECALFSEDEIPWDNLAFANIIDCLKRYFADKKQGFLPQRFPLHQVVLDKQKFMITRADELAI